MPTQNTKKIALVTGASSGMGKDIALRLIREGYTVYGAARRIDRMADLVAAGGFALPLDVTDDASITATVEHILAEHGRIDVLVNNAGYGQYGALEDVPIDLARRQFEVNLFGLARLTQLCLPSMRANRFGKIINISSIGGQIYTPLGGWYHASKFALEGYSNSLRLECQPFGIDVVVIQPGGIQTEWTAIASGEAEKNSGQGAYAGLVANFKSAETRVANSPPPAIISDLVVRALNARRPATRYAAGLMARPLLFIRWLVSDRLFDRLIMAAFR